MITTRSILESSIYLLTFSILIFSPVPFGSVEPWARLILQLQAFLLFVLWLLWSMYSDTNPNLSIKNYLPLLTFVLICLFQIIPLPEFILATLSKNSFEIWEKNRTILASIGFASESSMFTISLYPHATWEETLLLLSYIAFGFVVSRMFTAEGQIKTLLIPVFGVSIFEAAYGIYQYLVNSSIGTATGFATGTFVNHNHFAGFLEMSIPLALGYVLYLGEWHDKKSKPFIKDLVSSDNFQKQILILFLLAMMLLVIFLSGSRMGIFSTLLSLVFFYLAYSGFRKSGVKKAWMIFFVLAVALIYGLWIGLYSVFERFLKVEVDAPVRTLVWKDMLSIIKDFPLFGTGFGTFSYVYPLYKKYMEAPLVYTYAHNDYLQLIIETGILGFFSITTALTLFLFSRVRNLGRFSQKENNFRFFLSLGALSGIVSSLIHNLADFNLHIPSNALYFAFLIGFLKAIQTRA
ncbi:MAG: O-antigen polymerase involved in exopolysaccharide biosynthesis [Candidatus Dadabacteria bacterium CSP1-2]|nr:MAG: O-antigen polymerase involved in exopolysaccharide biosynthesis [Candidatus Dadabacteria bacterium CSP1-2]